MCPNDARPLSRGTYLIVLDDCVVSLDLAETMAEYDPNAGLTVCRTMNEAVAALQFVEQIKTAFIGQSPALFLASPLAAMIASRGGRVVLIGDEAEATGESAGWSVLYRPFSTEVVLSYLAQSALH